MVESMVPVYPQALSNESIGSVGTGGSCSFAISTKGTAFSWGFGENLQLAGDDEVVSMLHHK